jgi:hypothetical protein
MQLHFQGQRSSRTYFRCFWVYVVNSMRVILRNRSVIRRTSCDCAVLTESPVKCNAITFFNFQGQRSNRTHFRRCWGYVDNTKRVTLRIWSLIQSTPCALRFVNCVARQMQCNYIFQFSRTKIKSNVFPLLLDLGRQLDAPYTLHLKLTAEHIIRFPLH